MHPAARAGTVIYWLALVAWIGGLIAAAVAAPSVFGALGDLPVTIESFEAYPHLEHGRLAAGMVMERVFWIVDLIQFVAAPVVAATLVVQLVAAGARFRAPSNLVRTICIVGAAVLLAYRAAALAPTLNRELRAYWQAAEAGRVEVARAHRDRFNEDHPTASAIFTISLVLLFVVAGASAVAGSPGPAPPAAPTLEPPELLRRRR